MNCRHLFLALLFAHAVFAAYATPPTRVMWVYETPELLRSQPARAELIEFCKPREITDLFLQVHFVGKTKDEPLTIEGAAELKTLLREAKANGLRVHALAGDPGDTLRRNHERVLRRVEALAVFNESAPPEERFAGVHFDIEPHALREWAKASDSEKAELLTQLVEVNAKVVERLHARAPGVIYGADITFWFDKTKPDGTPVFPVTFCGVTADPTQHLLGLADHLALMSYRGAAEGKNGLIGIVARSIAAADAAKGRVFVGVKMAKIGPGNESFYGRTEQEMMTELRKVDAAYSEHPGYAGIAYFMYGAFKAMPR